MAKFNVDQIRLLINQRDQSVLKARYNDLYKQLRGFSTSDEEKILFAAIESMTPTKLNLMVLNAKCVLNELVEKLDQLTLDDIKSGDAKLLREYYRWLIFIDDLCSKFLDKTKQKDGSQQKKNSIRANVVSFRNYAGKQHKAVLNGFVQGFRIEEDAAQADSSLVDALDLAESVAYYSDNSHDSVNINSALIHDVKKGNLPKFSGVPVGEENKKSNIEESLKSLIAELDKQIKSLEPKKRGWFETLAKIDKKQEQRNFLIHYRDNLFGVLQGKKIFGHGAHLIQIESLSKDYPKALSGLNNPVFNLMKRLGRQLVRTEVDHQEYSNLNIESRISLFKKQFESLIKELHGLIEKLDGEINSLDQPAFVTGKLSFFAGRKRDIKSDKKEFLVKLKNALVTNLNQQGGMKYQDLQSSLKEFLLDHPKVYKGFHNRTQYLVMRLMRLLDEHADLLLNLNADGWQCEFDPVNTINQTFNSA